MLYDIGLTSKRNATVSTLSGGMKRKLSVAMYKYILKENFQMNN